MASASRERCELDFSVQKVLSQLEREYQGHPGFKHFFWDYMAQGQYDLDFLRKYSLHYYEHVRVFRLYLAGAMTVVKVEGLQVKASLHVIFLELSSFFVVT